MLLTAWLMSLVSLRSVDLVGLFLSSVPVDLDSSEVGVPVADESGVISTVFGS